jgi:hypothetical protein
MAELFYTIYIWCCAALNSRTMIMRIPGFIVALMLLASSPARADLPKVAVFDFELLDTSLRAKSMGRGRTNNGG